MIDLKNPPKKIQALAEPLRALAVQHANQLLDQGVDEPEAVERAVERTREHGAERVKDTSEVPGGRARPTGET